MKGATIRHRLAQMGMAQVELARLLGVTPQTVSKMLYSSNLQTGTLERICEVLNLPISFFYDDNSSPQENDEPKGYAKRKSNIIEYKPAYGTMAVSPKDGETVFDDSVKKIWETCHIGEKVRGLLRSQHKKMSTLCKYVGITEPGMHKVFDRDSCNINVLLKMSEFFNVPVTYFLPEDRHAKAETEKDREIQYLKGQLKAYENTLATVLQGMKGTENVDLFAIHSASE